MVRRTQASRRRRTAVAGGALLLASVIASGCGSSDSLPSKDDAPRGADAPAEPREVTAPNPDEQLTTAMGESGEALTTAGCSFGSYEEADAEHVDDGDELPGGDFPPTSGTHYQDWAPFGLYDESVQDGYAVHNLEHGGVVVWLGTEVGDDVRTAVAALLDDDEKWLVAPRADIPGLFSAAWTKGLSCPPQALETLGAETTAELLDAWYDEVASTGSKAEKDVPAYAGAMKEPSPERDISTEAPF